MTLTISAKDRPKDKNFHYSLEIPDRQLLLTTLAICGTIIFCSAAKYLTKK
ncbi:hypothetical protein ACVR1G_04070 [Streptococcus dentasini]